jgi:undecaprenyl phosphate N,N'-diacetylbacillosamine 1-phosphate transferase
MKKTFYSKYLKRCIDFYLSLIALIVLSPFLFLVISFQFIFNGTPIFFIQSRVGKDEKIFKLIKFRTMNNRVDKNGNLLPDLERRTWFGSLLRKTSIDELPSLLNILKGDMAMIGPRPLLVDYLPLYNQGQKKRHLVRPGLSGLAQINGRNSISWEDKFALDVNYLNRISFFLDLKIIVITLYKIVFLINKDINQSQNDTMSKFTGKN